MSDSVEDFLEEVDWVSNEVGAIISGKRDILESENTEAYRKKLKEDEERKKEEAIKRGRESKGIKFDKFKHYCKYCSREFDLETPKCTICGRDTQSNEERKIELLSKVEEYKEQRALKGERKLRWENWKKTEAMLYRKSSTNYKKWEFFEDDDEEKEPEPDFIPPENDPNFAALEKDIKDRAEKRKRDLAIAMDLKEKGNEFYKQGKYRNAIAKYEEALENKKDMMVLYTNCAIAKLRIEDYDGAIKDCSKVIDYYEVFDKEFEANKETVFKALFRRADAYRSKKMFCEAVIDYEKALEIKNDKEIEKILERCREEAVDSTIVATTEEIQSSESIISNLDTPEKIQTFRVSGGYQILFKRIYESQDTEALKVLEFLMNDETKFMNLHPIILPLYDKRQTAAVVMMETLKKYKENHSFCESLVKICALAIENSHIRDEIAKHSAITKGKRFYRQVLELFLSNPSFVKNVVPMLSNLCLTIHKTALERKPSPGNMKSLIRYNWNLFSSVFVPLLESAQTEALGLLCNISTDPKVKKLILGNEDMVKKSVKFACESNKVLDLERALGIMINCSCMPTDSEKAATYVLDFWAANLRVFKLETDIFEINDRAFRLLFRLLQLKSNIIELVVNEPDVIKLLISNLTTIHMDNIVKILAAGTAHKIFVQLLPLEKIGQFLMNTTSQCLTGDKIDDRVANICLAVGRIVTHLPESSLYFTESIPIIIRIVKEKHGPVRKNVAICLGKLCNNERNKEVMREAHGLEVLSSIMDYVK
ncbi:hypothetical protein SteCoe_29797 [Stentor coeruleus]|uniref:Uncharacterized protein n=1 Tax=Stentor coeruleus TaxID=5963 RepID=A0A1R2B539_9CILI|nr:hypothetical protein SteCoe_29797 [Stentor coeruleus]